MNKIEELTRSIIHMSKPVLEWVKQELEDHKLENSNINYVKAVQSLIAIEELKELLEKRPNEFSSKKFTQTKLKL